MNIQLFLVKLEYSNALSEEYSKQCILFLFWDRSQYMYLFEHHFIIWTVEFLRRKYADSNTRLSQLLRSRSGHGHLKVKG